MPIAGGRLWYIPASGPGSPIGGMLYMYAGGNICIVGKGDAGGGMIGRLLATDEPGDMNGTDGNICWPFGYPVGGGEERGGGICWLCDGAYCADCGVVANPGVVGNGLRGFGA